MKTRLPNWEELARLAAAVSQGMKKKPVEAVAYALELYHETQIALERAAIEAGGIPDSGSLDLDLTIEKIETMQRYEKTVPLPTKFPATLDDFFRLIVKARTVADATKRLRDFLCYSYFKSGNTQKNDAGAYAANQIQKMKDGDKNGGYFAQQQWRSFAGHYMDWWKRQRSFKARESARHRKKRR